MYMYPVVEILLRIVIKILEDTNRILPQDPAKFCPRSCLRSYRNLQDKILQDPKQGPSHFIRIVLRILPTLQDLTQNPIHFTGSYTGSCPPHGILYRILSTSQDLTQDPAHLIRSFTGSCPLHRILHRILSTSYDLTQDPVHFIGSYTGSCPFHRIIGS